MVVRMCRLEKDEECDQCGECAVSTPIAIPLPEREVALSHIGLIRDLANLAMRAVEDGFVADAVNALTFARRHASRGVNVMWKFMPQPVEGPQNAVPADSETE